MFRSTLHAAALAGALALLPGSATRPPTGTITGTVTDTAGAPIVNASVSVLSTSLRVLTDARGHFEIDKVRPGTWSVRAAFLGYRAIRVDSVRVRAGDTTILHIILSPSSVMLQDIEVTAGPPSSPKDEVATRQRIEGRFTHVLPVDRATQAMTLLPGVVGNSSEQAAVSVTTHDPRPLATLGAGTTTNWNTEEYKRIEDNQFLAASTNPLSTFSIDVDRASYSNVRRFLTQGQLPPADAVRIEELVNYFTYDYAEPHGRHPFTIAADAAPAPWNPRHQLVRIGIQGKRYRISGAHGRAPLLPPSNLVFLIDVSGSMQSPDKLPLVKQAFHTLVEHLGERDRVAIVVYAGNAGLVLPPTPGNDKETILRAIDRLEAGGSTAGGAGIQLAYDVARRCFLSEGNNRVILATDGDFNVGVSSEGELTRLIERRRTEGTYLTVLGFGTGNYKDSRMEALADRGNGNYAYIDNALEARKVFGTELTGTLFTIAKDVKIQVEFNPARVRAYRLIGYENRLLAKEDFNDDTKDAGELGAGHSVTALYEVVPVESDDDFVLATQDTLRYQRPSIPVGEHTNEWLTVKLRYKPPASEQSELIAFPLTDRDMHRRLTDDFAFAASVAEFGMLLRNSEFRGGSSWGNVRELARAGIGDDESGLRAEFLSLVRRAAAMQERETASRE